MARAKNNPEADAPTKPSPGEPVAAPVAIVRVPGGWAVRTFLVSSDAPHEDTEVDSFASCMGRVVRELAKGAK